MSKEKSDQSKTKKELIKELTAIRQRVADWEKKDKEQEELLKAIIESSSDGILVVDEKGKVTHTNGRFAEMWRIPKKLVETRDDKKLQDYVLDQLQDPQAFLSKVQRLYNSAEMDFDTLLFKDNRVFDRVSSPLMRKGEIAGRVWAFRDVTERKRAEEEKQKLEKQLQYALKMEAIGTLAGGIAHDFNNILGVIIGFTELASDDVPDDSITQENLQQVLTAANRAKELVKQILAFSRKDKEERKPVLLCNIVRESLTLLRASLPTTIDIRSNIETHVNPILANQTQIHQVIMNLFTNAAYAMREQGGILEITLREIDPDQDSISYKGMEHGKYQLLSVSDTGAGIPPGIKNRIFEPYFTTKKLGEGSGMGLAVVYGIVKNHGGKITVYSEPGKGTTFHVFLKEAGKEKKMPEEETYPTEHIPVGNENILFVDDEQGIVELGQQMLQKLGYRVVSASSSLKALEIFRSDPSQFDLVISDQTMPKMTGVQLCKELKNIRPDIPVILCTGFSKSINEESYKFQGINAFLMKPVTKKEVAVVIRRVLDDQ